MQRCNVKAFIVDGNNDAANEGGFGHGGSGGGAYQTELLASGLRFPGLRISLSRALTICPKLGRSLRPFSQQSSMSWCRTRGQSMGAGSRYPSSMALITWSTVTEAHFGPHMSISHGLTHTKPSAPSPALDFFFFYKEGDVFPLSFPE